MFNLTGSELVFLLILALIILGPEKLPEAVRKFGKTYSEVRKMATGFQSELKTALDEPMREVRETADLMRKSVTMDDSDLGIKDLFKGGPSGLLNALAGTNTPAGEPAADPAQPAATEAAPTTPAPEPETPPPGPNFTSAAPAAPSPGPNFTSAAPTASQWATQPAGNEPPLAEPAPASAPEPASEPPADGAEGAT